MINDVYLSRQAGKIKVFLNKAGETELFRQMDLAKSYKNLSEEYKLWLKNPLTIPFEYLNNPAKNYILKRKRKGK